MYYNSIILNVTKLVSLTKMIMPFAQVMKNKDCTFDIKKDLTEKYELTKSLKQSDELAFLLFNLTREHAVKMCIRDRRMAAWTHNKLD